MAARRVAAERWRARLVAYVVVLVLVVCAVATLEPWPFSSLRLFSGIRTAEQVQLRLITVDDAGRRDPVSFGDQKLVASAAARQVPTIARLPSGQQQSLVRTLLRVGGKDPDAFRSVVVERTVRRLDPDGGPPAVLDRRDIVTVDLS